MKLITIPRWCALACLSAVLAGCDEHSLEPPAREAEPPATPAAATAASTTYDFVDNARINTLGLAPGWTCQAFVYQNDVWLRTYRNGTGTFDYRIGAGGAIAQMRDVQANYLNILAPSDLKTQHVVQWTLGSSNVHPPYPNATFLLAQAGTAGNRLAPTQEVNIRNLGSTCEIDVWSVPQDAWLTELQSVFKTRVSALTRYRVVDEGNLVVRRVLQAGGLYRSGTQEPFVNLYVEGWTPFKRPAFSALALRVDHDGSPMWWYRAGYNIPDNDNPGLDVTQTFGYGIVYKEESQAGSRAVALVYGARHPCYYQYGVCSRYGTHVLKTDSWDTGIGVLPRMQLGSPPSGTVFDHYQVLVPRRGLDGAMASNVFRIEPLVPAPRVYGPATRLDPATAAIVNRVRGNMNVTGTRTDNLAPLIR